MKERNKERGDSDRSGAASGVGEKDNVVAKPLTQDHKLSWTGSCKNFHASSP